MQTQDTHIKAYELNLDKINEGYLCSPVICYAPDRGKAKTILMNKIRYEGYTISSTGKELDLLNMPIKRAKDYDRIEFEGQYLTKHKISSILEERERNNELDGILNNPSITHCYIKKRGAYYRPGSSGYTDYQHRAGIFSKIEAVSDGKSCNELVIIPINIEEHNKMIEDEINSLKTRIILA